MTTQGQQANSFHGFLLILTAVMPVMAIVTLVPVLPLLGKEFAHVPGSEYLVPAALTIPAFCLAVFSPAAGWLADRMGRKKLLLISLVLYSVIGVWPYFLSDLKSIIAARFCLGIVEAAIMTIATTLIGDYFAGARRERWLGIQVAAISVAAVVLVWVGGMLGQAFGSRAPFLLYLVGVPLSIVCFFVLFEPISEHSSNDQKSPLPLARLAPLVVGGFVIGILFYVIVVKLGAILSMVTEPTPRLVGQMSAITNFAMILGSLVFGIVKSRASAPAMICLGALITSVGYIVIPNSGTVSWIVAGCALVTFSVGIMLPTFLTWILSFLALEVRGRGTGLWQGAFFLGQFIAPITAVALSKLFGGIEGVFYFFALTAALVVIIAGLNIKNSLPLTQRSNVAS